MPTLHKTFSPRSTRSTLLFLALVALIPGCKSLQSKPNTLQRFEFAQAQMGLEFRITLYAESEALATTAVTAAYVRIAELNMVLSDYDSDSELSRLSLSSGSGTWVDVSDDLWRILETGQTLSRQSGGAFDLTIGPSVNLWRRARRQKRLPDQDLLASMNERVGYHYLELDSATRTARLSKPKMRLDAGGIAKGFAMDEALQVLEAHGVARAMIHGGGDMVFGDPPPGQAGWRIQLSETDLPALLLGNAALATSGDLVQHLEIDGARYSHIVDPRTGIGLTNRSLVHVIAPSGIEADSLSTALNILKEHEGRELLRRHPKVEARVSTAADGETRVFQTDGFSSFLASE